MVDKKTAEIIRSYLLTHQETVAVAESVTAGCIQRDLSTIPDAEMFFQGGITTYNIGQKYKHLCVEPIHAKNCNCVSQQVATQMALNVCALFNADWGIGITGYATPVKNSGNKLFAYYTITYKGQIIKTDRIESKKLKPYNVQQFYCDEIIKLLKNDMRDK